MTWSRTIKRTSGFFSPVYSHGGAEILHNEPIVIYLHLSSSSVGEINQWWSHRLTQCTHCSAGFWCGCMTQSCLAWSFISCTPWLPHHSWSLSMNARVEKSSAIGEMLCIYLQHHSGQFIRTNGTKSFCLKVKHLPVSLRILLFGCCPVTSAWLSMSKAAATHWWFQECLSKLESDAESPRGGE